MTIPLIPIILATAALGSGIVQGISSIKNAKSEAEALKETTTEKVDERARQAKKLMQQQKTSFLKSGVYFTGTPQEVINETYETSQKDINAMVNNLNSKTMNLYRQGKTAFFNSIMEGISSAGMSYFMSGGSKDLLSGVSSAAKNKAQTIYQNTTGKYKGGFGNLKTNNGLNIEDIIENV